jgi:hypothetical protein
VSAPAPQTACHVNGSGRPRRAAPARPMTLNRVMALGPPQAARKAPQDNLAMSQNNAVIKATIAT